MAVAVAAWVGGWARGLFLYLNVWLDLRIHSALSSLPCDTISIKHRSASVQPTTRSLAPGPARLSAELQGHSDVVAGVEVGPSLVGGAFLTCFSLVIRFV